MINYGISAHFKGDCLGVASVNEGFVMVDSLLIHFFRMSSHVSAVKQV